MGKIMIKTAEEVRQKITGRKKDKKETRWWKDEIQYTLKDKKKAYRRLKDGTGDQAEYKRRTKEAKRAVAKAKAEAWKEWYAETALPLLERGTKRGRTRFTGLLKIRRTSLN